MKEKVIAWINEHGSIIATEMTGVPVPVDHLDFHAANIYGESEMLFNPIGDSTWEDYNAQMVAMDEPNQQCDLGCKKLFKYYRYTTD